MNRNIINHLTLCAMAFAMLSVTLASGCAGAGSNMEFPALVERATVMPSGEPSHITVQHVLIGFNGSMPGKNVSRTRGEAEMLAKEILQRARNGEDFDALVEQFTDDSPPGIYHMANHGQASDMTSQDVSKQVFARSGMVPAFGNVGFPLQVGEVGMSQYDPSGSPFGWHIVKRLR